MPDEKLSKTLNTGNQEDLNLNLQWKSAVENEIFVYAGFIQPGKHQILVKDNRDRYFAREIVIDIRKRDIDPHQAPANEEYRQGIRRYTSNTGEDIIDLDGSVFMNFKRYTKEIIIDCLKADMATSVLEYLLDSE